MFAFDDFPSLNELLDAVSAGDESAKESLYELCNPEFYKSAQSDLWVRKCYAPGDHAPEVMNAAWSKIYKGIKGLRERNRFFYWVNVIISNETNTHLTHCIKEQKEVPFEDAHEENEPDACLYNAYEIARSNEQIDLIMAFALKLHPNLPDILLHHDIEGMSFNETAIRIGEPYDKVRRIYYNNLGKLRSMLEDMERKFEQRPDGPKEPLSREIIRREIQLSRKA